MATTSLLDTLRQMSAVDCDTFDSEAAKKLGPFVDCTSNQAIAFSELSKLNADGSFLHERLIIDSISDASKMLDQQLLGHDIARDELAVDFMMVRLALKIEPHLTGYSHIQTNPRWSYDKDRTIKNAERIVAIFKHLAPTYDSKRVCIKIPATWEGLQACRVLEKKGIATLATTMFCMEQAVLAEDVGCTYIAPYVNELKVHFQKGYVDQHKAFAFCGAVQHYYRCIQAKTKVLPASLTSIDDVLQLAGVDHITVAPALLAELAATPTEGYKGKIGSAVKSTKQPKELEVGGIGKNMYAQILEDEGAWRLAFSRSEEGRNEGKIIQAINIFFGMQEFLEALVRKMDDKVERG